MKTRIDAIIELTKLGWTAEEIKAAFDTPTEERIIIQPMPYPVLTVPMPTPYTAPPRPWWQEPVVTWQTSSVTISSVYYGDDAPPVADMVPG